MTDTGTANMLDKLREADFYMEPEVMGREHVDDGYHGHKDTAGTSGGPSHGQHGHSNAPGWQRAVSRG